MLTEITREDQYRKGNAKLDLPETTTLEEPTTTAPEPKPTTTAAIPEPDPEREAGEVAEEAGEVEEEEAKEAKEAGVGKGKKAKKAKKDKQAKTAKTAKPAKSAPFGKAKAKVPKAFKAVADVEDVQIAAKAPKKAKATKATKSVPFGKAKAAKLATKSERHSLKGSGAVPLLLCVTFGAVFAVFLVLSLSHQHSSKVLDLKSILLCPRSRSAPVFADYEGLALLGGVSMMGHQSVAVLQRDEEMASAPTTSM